MSNEEIARSLQVGDIVNVQGNRGEVIEYKHIEIDGVPCTYFKVKFTGQGWNSGYSYGWFGSSDWAFNYKCGGGK